MAMFLTIALILISIIGGSAAVVTQPVVHPIDSQPPAVDAERLQAHVKHLSVDLHPRSYDELKNTEAVVQYIVSEFKSAGGAVTTQDVLAEGVTYKNVIARFGPASGPVVVIGAHYDSCNDIEGVTPGADDNASGVAGLLELARLLGKSPQAHAIELVAYALEEPPYFRTEQMGSAVHAHALKSVNADVEFMLSLEMIGYFSDAPRSQSYPFPGMSHLYSDKGDFIAIVGKLSDLGTTRRIKSVMKGATSLPVYSINAPPLLQGVDFSDHLNYWYEGFPAFMVTDTAFMRNQNYHLPGDTYEKLDYERMAKVVQGVYEVTQLARRPT